MDDLISRADAIDAMCCDCEGEHYPQCDQKQYCKEVKALLALPSAEANPTVVRCKTMIPYGDFREWAKRIREDNPNVIVIPFDAEVASADAVQCLNNHEVACLLAELFGDYCACNYNGIDEWLPMVCDFKDNCQTVGVACWEQFLKHYERREPDKCE